eukprot:CAMPEP_0174351352 /NCGR_PEP_ID=MMETSP0811_2-20130205/8707_1 /TAXON_ID=73025 ORGANISM="Eutreptiella gymnastica-like, Strain CCMP1594" /NCGR_SAMPLE_ID=MMETSP0811_2 /ASSEMBLY_ACC=CAM_ASM_000667 /LENGTH=62 /DNA_ID=CAMNT_0015480499 /DNA_START=533 /DNA_END=721 /DNA_ORIENTATION=-
MAQCRPHHAPLLSDPRWPQKGVLQAYLRACATTKGRDMPEADAITARQHLQATTPTPTPHRG